jgi:hypothetical protein
MIIALDYDNTYTADPKLWDRFIKDAEANGHTVKIVTMRYPPGADDYPSETIKNAPCEVIYTSRIAKAKIVKADIWIDDSPHWIFQDALV